MPPVIIADTSCLILLANIGELSLLQKLYTSITVTQIIADEFGEPLPEWIVVKNPGGDFSRQTAVNVLDKGEASAISLALEIQDSLLIIDEQKGRNVATHLGLKITGTLGVVAQAKLQGIIDAAFPIIQKMLQTDFRLSRELVQATLRELDEEL